MVNLPAGHRTIYLTAFDCAGNSATTNLDYSIAVDDGTDNGAGEGSDLIMMPLIVGIIVAATIITIVFLVKRNRGASTLPADLHRSGVFMKAFSLCQSDNHVPDLIQTLS
jgi:hypothetical protein